MLTCFVVFDIKSSALTHGDIGQMDMHVRMFDDLQRGPSDNPTVGIILCAAKDESIVRYSVLHGSEQLFASRYTLVLPTEEQLRTELIREQQWLETHLPETRSPAAGQKRSSSRTKTTKADTSTHREKLK